MRKVTFYCGAIFGICCIARGLYSAESADPDSKAIRSVDQQYIEAFNSKNAADAVRSFTDDALYITDDGRTLRGREEIRRALETQFQDLGDSTLELKVYSLEFTPDKKKAVERGISVVTVEGIEEPSSYVADFVKQGNDWRVSRVTEQAEAASTDHLRQLSWMIGDWTDQSEGVTVRTKCEWGLDRAFIIRRFAVVAPGIRDLRGIEYIGWDPVRGEITSSYFDSSGGLGNGRWRRDGNRWIEDSCGVTPEGETASATHVYTRINDDRFTWQSINRQVGAEKQDDLPEVSIVRNRDEGKQGEGSKAERGNL